MDGRKFVIVSPISMEGEFAQHPAIQKINTIINYININRYRQSSEKDSEYRQQNPKASKGADIEFREKLADQLNQQANVIGVMQQVRTAVEKKYLNSFDADLHFTRFQEKAEQFFKFIGFAHLTAVELAIVGMMVDVLIILLYQARDDFSEDAELIAIVNKQNELITIRESIAACMAYHQAVFDNNYLSKNKNEFTYSDIIINFLDIIEEETGRAFTEERNQLWPDTSYLQILPDVPFYKMEEPRTVASYFAQFIVSPPPGEEHVHQLQDDVREEMHLLSDDQEEKNSHLLQSQPDLSTEESVSTGCFPGFWTWSKSETTASTGLILDDTVVDLDESDSCSTEPDRHAFDDVISLMDTFNRHAHEQLEKMEMESRLRTELLDLQQRLRSEIDQLQASGCFAFFRLGTLRKKIAKHAALDYVLQASTLEELGHRASEKLNGDDKGLVCAGWRSRTVAALQHVEGVVRLNTIVTKARFELL